MSGRGRAKEAVRAAAPPPGKEGEKEERERAREEAQKKGETASGERGPEEVCCAAAGAASPSAVFRFACRENAGAQGKGGENEKRRQGMAMREEGERGGGLGKKRRFCCFAFSVGSAAWLCSDAPGALGACAASEAYACACPRPLRRAARGKREPELLRWVA